jgi:alkylation response protein AidB-like acyl-CoA dehydrogenase
MDIAYSPSEQALRREIRAFFRSACDPGTRRKLLLGQRLEKAEVVQWQQVLHARGWAVAAWPREWGGTGWSPVEQSIFNEEIYLAPVPEPLSQNVKMVGPVLIAFGTADQKARFLPRIARLDDWFCQGFSEPGAGSDLASLRTTARRDGAHYVVNGQKLWTTGAHNADWMFCLVRTDPAARAQRGISFLLIDMRSPGVTVRSIRSIDGARELNEVFLDEVRVPADQLVGEENRGWDCAKYLLVNERTNIARLGMSRQRLRRARAIAAGTGPAGASLLDDPVFARRLAVAQAELKALEITQLRMLSARTAQPTGLDPMSSVLKIRGSELQQVTAELMLDAAGELGLLDATAGERVQRPSEVLPENAHGHILESLPPAGSGQASGDTTPPEWAPGVSATYFFSRAASIYGGSNEIQRNIVAKAILGL